MESRGIPDGQRAVSASPKQDDLREDNVLISADMTVEELLGAHPQISQYLADRGIVCIRCGEPYWGTLRELAGHKGLEDEIDRIVDEISERLIPEPHDQTS